MKKRMKTVLLTCMTFLLLLIMIPGTKVNAASLEQTDATQNSITIAWEAQNKALNYQIVLITYDKQYQRTETLLATLPATQTSYTISRLSAGTAYSIQVKYDYPGYSSTYSSPLGYLYNAKTLPGKVTNVKQSRWYYFIKSFQTEWDKQTAADGYEYQVTTSSNKKKASGESSYNNLSVEKIKNNMVYIVRVRAYTVLNGQKIYGPWSDKCYCFTQPRITGIKQSGNKLTIKWGKVSGATGYDVYLSTKKTSGYKKVKSVGSKTNQVTISKFKGKKLSTKKTYYFYIVTKKKVGRITNKSGRLYYWNSKQGVNTFGYF